MKHEFSVTTTKRRQLQDITDQVRRVVESSSVTQGICIVFCPHTTAGITINENADSDVQHDMLMHLGEMVPPRRDFRHNEGNSDAHIQASLMGSSATVIIEDSRLLLGTWQGIYFCEFDGPRSRKVYVKTLAG